LGTEFIGSCEGHGRVNPKFSGFVICRGDNTSLGWISHAANDNRFPFQIRIPFFVDSGKKASMSICRILLMEEMIKIRRDYFKRVEIRNGDMARPDRIIATRQI
jgi:hypothetical protein